MNDIKNIIVTLCGLFGGFITGLFGGWDSGLTTLIIFMIIDYISGIVVAGVFKKSPKTDSGALQSKAGFKGLCKKGLILLIVLVACRLDITMGTNFIRDSVIIAFIVNECISIIENAGLMGIPIPKQITKAIELLKKSGDDDE